MIHGEEEAIKAEEAAKALFEGKGNLESMPTVEIDNKDMTIVEALVLSGIAPSKGQAKTLVSQGSVSVNDKKIDDISYKLSNDFTDAYAIIKKGKKIFYKFELKK